MQWSEVAMMYRYLSAVRLVQYYELPLVQYSEV